MLIVENPWKKTLTCPASIRESRESIRWWSVRRRSFNSSTETSPTLSPKRKYRGLQFAQQKKTTIQESPTIQESNAYMDEHLFQVFESASESSICGESE